MNAKEEINNLWDVQLAESTDISGKAQLLAFLLFIRSGKIENQFLFCGELKETTTGNDIFELMDQNIDSKGLR